MPLKQKLWKKPKCFRTLHLVELEQEERSSRHQVEQKFLNLPTSTAASASLHHPVRGVEGERRTRSWWQITSLLPCMRLFFSPSWSWVRAAEADDDQRCGGSRQRAGLLSARRRGWKKVMKIRRTPPHPACPNAECTWPACSDSRASLPQGDSGDQQYQQHLWRYCSTCLHCDHFLGQLVSFT